MENKQAEKLSKQAIDAAKQAAGRGEMAIVFAILALVEELDELNRGWDAGLGTLTTIDK